MSANSAARLTNSNGSLGNNGNSQNGVRRPLSTSVLAYLTEKEEALKYVAASVKPSFIKLEAVLRGEFRALQLDIQFWRNELARIESEIGNLLRTVPETAPIPRWPDTWLMRAMAVVLLALIGGLALLGLLNSMQFAVLSTNNWWTAGMFAAPLLAVPFALKYLLEVMPQRSKPLVFVGLGFVGVVSVLMFIYTFANRFGLSIALNNGSGIEAFLSSREDNRLQLAAQMLTELSCGTALVLWFRRIMLGIGGIRQIVNPLLAPMQQARSEAQVTLQGLEKEAGEVQGDLDALPQRCMAAEAEGLALWYSVKAEAAQRAKLAEELTLVA